MIGWILAVLGLFVVQTLLPNATRAASGGAEQRAYLKGARDVEPPHTVMSGRMARALTNMFEALVVFLPLAVLAVATGRAEGWATLGAAVFFFARVAYIPAYASGIVPVRSAVWGIGHAGLVMMVVGLLVAGG
ncbi:MAG: MAPEG family protein [Maritimibacter sp.]|nr:MAPEG family protein [Maritimibacter sp.]